MAAKLNQSTIAKMYSDESEAYKFLESVLWKNGVVCPHCGCIGTAKYLEPRKGLRKTRKGNETYRRVWQCDECGQQFSVLVGTIFEDSHIPLSKWLLAIHEMNAAKNGVSALELQRKLGFGSYRTAWFMAHRIRYAIACPPLVNKLNGIVEADETYIGGKARFMHKSKRQHVIKGRGMVGKTPVLTVVERGGEARSQVIEDVTTKSLPEPIKANVDSQATLMTDTHSGYAEAGKHFAKHETVDHTKEEYVRGNVHINTAEGYFGQLKRSINGTYHHVSDKHLPRYLAEFDYRYSTRKSDDGTRTVRAIEQASGKRLMYRKPTANKGENLT